MKENTNSIEIRTFATMQEVTCLNGYLENNPVSEANYERIFGDYWFDPKVKCCRQKLNGELCKREHNFGFVAKLKDGSITIIGNCCAKDKFDADANIRKDRSKYINEKRRRERLSQLSELLDEREEILNKLDSLFNRLKTVQKRVSDFSNSLGTLTLRKVHEMAKTGRSSVFLDAITYHESKDEDGYIETERRSTSSRLGTLNGVSIFNEFTFQPILSQINAIRRAYESANEIEDDLKTSELESLTSTISQHASVAREVSNIEADEEAFYKNELTLLCYLVSDKSERYKTAQLVLELEGEQVGKGKAKQWLIDQDAALKEQLKADKIEIQG